MKIQTTSTVLLTVILAPLLLTFQAAADTSTIPDPRFGVVEAYQAPDAATALGAGWTRVTFRWNEIQPNGPGEWNVLPISDEMLSGELSRGRQVVGLLVTTPGWATDLAVGPGVPRSLHLPTDDPKNLWAGFVRTIVNRYAGRIDHWIVWNEPDIPGTHHMSWGGSVEDFVRLLQVAYTVARDTNPDAVIHLPAVTHWWNEDWFGDFLAALVDAPNAATNDYYFDVATLHVYFQPETVYDITVHYRDMMLGYGMVKPIWIGETNAAPSQDTAWPVSGAQFNVSLEQQAAYIVQAFSLGIAAGAERIAVYKMADTEADRQANPEPFGLVRQDGSRRPAFRAYQAATTYLSGYRTARWERRDTIATVTVDRGDRTT
ncbi:MAG: glycosyl hydrolase, partial [Anaerolineae bacterium]